MYSTIKICRHNVSSVRHFLPVTVCELETDFVPWCVTVMPSDRLFSLWDVTEMVIPYQGQSITAEDEYLIQSFKESCQIRLWMCLPLHYKYQNMHGSRRPWGNLLTQTYTQNLHPHDNSKCLSYHVLKATINDIWGLSSVAQQQKVIQRPNLLQKLMKDAGFSTKARVCKTYLCLTLLWSLSSARGKEMCKLQPEENSY